MLSPSLNMGVHRRVNPLFPEDQRALVLELLREATAAMKSVDLAERVQIAILKLSDGDLNQLDKALGLADRDWRDLLVAAGFARDTLAHRSWFPAGDAG